MYKRKPARGQEIEVDHAGRTTALPRRNQPPHQLAELGEGRLERADRLAAGAVGDDMVHPADQHDEPQERQPQRQLGHQPALGPGAFGILVDLVIGHHHHDRDEDAERTRRRLGGTASAIASRGSISIITTSTSR